MHETHSLFTYEMLLGIQRGAIRVNPNPKSLTQEYVKIDSDANHTCFGSTTKCDEGFTMSLFVRINAHPSLNRSIASTDVLAVCIDSGIKQNRVGSYAVYLDSTRHLVVAMILAEKLYTYSVQHKFIEGKFVYKDTDLHLNTDISVQKPYQLTLQNMFHDLMTLDFRGHEFVVWE